jgi:hypothetical protein
MTKSRVLAAVALWMLAGVLALYACGVLLNLGNDHPDNQPMAYVIVGGMALFFGLLAALTGLGLVFGTRRPVWAVAALVALFAAAVPYSALVGGPMGWFLNGLALVLFVLASGRLVIDASNRER